MNVVYVEQYRRAGAFGEMVWAALYARGPLEEGTPLWADARALAYETMARARQNLETVIAALRQEGYRFYGLPAMEGDAPVPWEPPDAATPALLERLSSLWGAVPLSLRAWYECVGAVSLCGEFPGDEPGLPPLRDPLVVYPLRYMIQQAEEAIEEAAGESLSRISIDIAPDIYHKSEQSGGAAYALHLPEARADAPLHDVRIPLRLPDSAPRPYLEIETRETFIEYLRRSLLWAGFPGLAFTGDPAPQVLGQLYGRMIPL